MDMKEDKSNVYIIGVNMNDSDPERIAFEAAIKIVGSMDDLVEQQEERKKQNHEL